MYFANVDSGALASSSRICLVYSLPSQSVCSGNWRLFTTTSYPAVHRCSWSTTSVVLIILLVAGRQSTLKSLLSYCLFGSKSDCPMILVLQTCLWQEIAKQGVCHIVHIQTETVRSWVELAGFWKDHAIVRADRIG